MKPHAISPSQIPFRPVQKNRKNRASPSRVLALCALASLLIAARPAPRTVALTQQPGSALEATAQKLLASDIKEARSHGDTPLLMVGSAHLAGERKPAALFVQLQSASFCGSAGCSTSVYVGGRRGWRKVLDSVSGAIKVDTTSHKGMHDLLVHEKDRWVWNGSVYTDTLPAPAVNLNDTTPAK